MTKISQRVVFISSKVDCNQLKILSDWTGLEPVSAEPRPWQGGILALFFVQNIKFLGKQPFQITSILLFQFSFPYQGFLFCKEHFNIS